MSRCQIERTTITRWVCSHSVHWGTTASLIVGPAKERTLIKVMSAGQVGTCVSSMSPLLLNMVFIQYVRLRLIFIKLLLNHVYCTQWLICQHNHVNHFFYKLGHGLAEFHTGQHVVVKCCCVFGFEKYCLWPWQNNVGCTDSVNFCDDISSYKLQSKSTSEATFLEPVWESVCVCVCLCVYVCACVCNYDVRAGKRVWSVKSQSRHPPKKPTWMDRWMDGLDPKPLIQSLGQHKSNK